MHTAFAGGLLLGAGATLVRSPRGHLEARNPLSLPREKRVLSVVDSRHVKRGKSCACPCIEAFDARLIGPAKQARVVWFEHGGADTGRLPRGPMVIIWDVYMSTLIATFSVFLGSAAPVNAAGFVVFDELDRDGTPATRPGFSCVAEAELGR